MSPQQSGGPSNPGLPPFPINGRPFEDQDVKNWLQYLVHLNTMQAQTIVKLEQNVSLLIEAQKVDRAERKRLEANQNFFMKLMLGGLATVTAALIPLVAASYLLAS